MKKKMGTDTKAAKKARPPPAVLRSFRAFPPFTLLAAPQARGTAAQASQGLASQ